MGYQQYKAVDWLGGLEVDSGILRACDQNDHRNPERVLEQRRVPGELADLSRPGTSYH